MSIARHVDSVNTSGDNPVVARPSGKTTSRKRTDPYHHGDLPRAMLQEAVRVIQKQGVEALTLRGVGQRLGVSRTALYRHFDSKNALLGAVAAEGFRAFTQALLDAWTGAGKGPAGFAAMGLAYVRFALDHPSHYRVMFGGYIRPGDMPHTHAEDPNAFGVLVGAIVEQQHQGLVRDDDPQMLARYIWSAVHGIAALALADVFRTRDEADAVTRFAMERLVNGIGTSPKV